MRISGKVLMGLIIVLILSMSVTFAQSNYYKVEEQEITEAFVQGKYPVVQNSNILVKSKINNKISKIVINFEQDIQEINNKGTETIGFIDYEVKANSENVFSIIINCSTMYKGAAHPNIYSYGLSFDEKGNLIQFSQVINEAKLQGNDKYSITNLNKAIYEQIGNTLYNFHKEVEVFPKEFYLDENMDLHVLFQRYDITPYAIGLVDINLQ